MRSVIPIDEFNLAKENSLTRIRGRRMRCAGLINCARFLMCLLVFLVLLANTLSGADVVDVSKLPPAAPSFDFVKDIKPVLEGACVRCHEEQKHKGAFRIDTRQGLLKGGKNDKAIVEGDSAKSPLIHYAARLVDDMEMPPKGKGEALTPQQIGLLRVWIDQGAQWPAGLTLVSTQPEEKLNLAALPPAAQRKIEFVKDIQPIFAASCYECHGPRKQEAQFRLDHKATALKGGELGVAIVPGKSIDSLLIHLVAGLKEEVMPKKGTRLTPDQVGVLRAWIDQGAEWPDSASIVLIDKRDHWSFKAPVKPAVPVVKNQAWPKNTIDNFVLAHLEMQGLEPAPEADKITLLRRISLDLIGLPPTIQEVDAFMADNSPNAYQTQVERLLASPHYGERWGRHWLDAARYADTDGFEKDKMRYAWAYRDWVINAFNRDLPYNQFVIEQLAGDQLPNPTQDQRIATGFLRNSMINEEGGVDPEQFRMEAMFDRMDAIGKSMLGLTIQCCQCHNHKYDPITQEEYYKIFAFLNNDYEAYSPVYTPAELMKRTDILRQIHELEGALQQQTPEWQSRMAKWEDEVKQGQPEWIVVQPAVDDISTGGQRYLPQKDGSLLAQGYAPTKHQVKLTVKTDVKNITAFRLELLTDANLPLNGPGRSFKGTCALTEFAVEAAPVDAPDKKAKVKLVKATADFEDKADTPLESNYEDKSGKKRITGPASYAIDGKEETGWGIDAGPGRRNTDRKAVFNAEKPIGGGAGNDKGTLLTFLLKQNHGGWNSDDLMTNNLGRFRLSITTAPDAVADPLPKGVRDIIAIAREQRTPAQAATVFSYWRTTVAEWKDINAKIEELWKQHPNPATSLVLQAREQMRDTHLLKRGDWLKPEKSVNPGVPAILNPLASDAPPTRLTFARWLVDPKSPTAARAFVNRIWQAYFGTGIVSTSEDLGTQCEAPSHPELLDWLACEFMERGWSVKAMQRLVVNSSTYRQSSKITPEIYAKDQYNRLLAHGARFRVEGEIVHDIGLSVSGLLNPALGGRSVFPPAPAFLFLPPASYAPFPWVDETGPDRYRRGVYTFRRRSTPYPLLQTFDTPEGNTSCVRRARSNTPLQALMTLNETLFMESAQAFARRILEEGGKTDIDRINYAFRRALSRLPGAEEQKTLLALIATQRARIADGWINPYELATGKNVKPEVPAGTNPAQLAAYTVISRVLLNLDETITKE